MQEGLPENIKHIKGGTCQMPESSVMFKATVNDLFIIMKEESDFESILEQIANKIDSAGRFFKGVSLNVKYRGKKLTKDEENRILELLVRRSGAEIRKIEEDIQEAPETVEYAPNHKKIKINKFYFKGIDEGPAKFYRGTVRSGQLVESKGNLVVIGDVNPGGEVIANGNVVVVGALRGIVHAGADGNKEAIVVALNLQPMQLRIADVITRSPDGKSSGNILVPEMAYVKDDIVYIEPFLPQR